MPQVGAFIVGAFGWGTGAALTGAAATAYVAGTAFAGTVIGGLTVKLLTSVAITALQAALMSDPAQGGGITISTTLRGEDNPETIILGRYATAGHCVYVNSHGRSRRWLTHVVEVCSAPGATLNRLMLGDQWVTLAEAPMPGYEQYGLPVTSEDYEGGYVFVKYYDGSQTTADPMLVDKYGADPDRPWASTAIGAGLCYAVLTFYHHAEILPQIPPYRFELDGIPLYDIRKDSTRGGSGPQRMDDPSTWVQTDNAAVIVWNVLKGVPLPGGEIWGGGFDVSFMPTSVSTLAMNRCDVPVALSEGTEPTYRAAFEAALTQEPAATVTELLKACSGTIADMGYAWTMAVGAPALPVYAVSDDDLIVSKSQTLDPFPSLADTYNAVSVRYPSPEHLWESHEAPLRTDAAAEASDVFGRRTASLTLPAAPYGDQVQRLSLAWLNDNRRFIRHIVNVPPDAAALDMVDSLDWTSDRNGYVDKTFSLYEIAEDLRTCGRQFSIRERNADDYNWTSSAELPSPPTTTATPQVAEGVAGFDATASSVVDADGVARRAAIEITWDSEIAAQGIRWEIRLDGQTTVQLYGDTQEVSDGIEVLTSGILPDTAYQIRARLIAERKTAWTAWLPVTTPDVRIGTDDLSDPVRTSLEAADAAFDAAELLRTDHDALVGDFIGDLATAFAETNSRASAGFNGWLKDPIFTDWEPGNISSANWDVRSNIGNYGTEGGGAYGGGLTLNIPSGATSTALIASSNAKGFVGADPTIDYVVSELELEYIAGNPNSSTIRVDWSTDGVTWVPGSFTTPAGTFGEGLFDRIGLTPKPGVRQAVAVLWKRPTGYSNHIRSRFFPKSGAVTGAVQMVVHRANLRAATKADIDAGAVIAVASTTLGQVVTAVGAGAAVAALNAGLTAQVGAQAAQISTLQGASTSQAVSIAILQTDLSVSIGTVNATLTQQASVIASLNGIASSSYHIGVGAGGVAAGAYFFVRNAAGGLEQASNIKWAADQVTVQGDLFVTPGVINHNFDMVDAAPFSSPNGASFLIAQTTNALFGKKYLHISPNAATVEVWGSTKDTEWLAVSPSTEYLVSAAASTSATNQAKTSVYIEYGSVSSTGVVVPIAGSRVLIHQNVGAVSRASVSSISPNTAKRARFVTVREAGSAGNTAAAAAGGFAIEKKNGAETIIDGSISGRHIQAGSMSADDIKAGVLESRFLKITELLKIDSGTGAFSVGKNSAYDVTNDGAYFGRTLESGGTAGFGFMAGKRVSGVDQYIQATSQSGLRLVNADFFVTAAAAPITNDATASQTIVLPVGTVTLDLTLQAAGGGGMAGNGVGGTGTITPSTAGGNVTVELWDGATFTGVSWTATGGPAQAGQHANPSGWNGESSPLGVGGVVVGPGQGQSGGDGTGYGAGGGGGTGGSDRSGGNGGYAGQYVFIDRYSLVGIANPTLVIVIGAPGLGALRQPGSNAGPKGGDGAPGLVRYATRSAVETRASVLPLVPTFTGTISKTSGGKLTFPPLGAGLWQLSAVGGNLLLDTVETHMNGQTIILKNGAFASFISDKTPVDLAVSTTAVTYIYQFFKLGAWV